jgi:peptide/nickel transport system permease protein
MTVLAIATVAIAGGRLESVAVAIAVLNAPRFMRLIRSEGLTVRESRYIEAAVAISMSRTRLMLRHLLPNTYGVVIVQASLGAAHAIIIVATMSFLGIGVSPIDASWGGMIQGGARVIVSGQWWPVAFPGIAVFVAVLLFNTIADGLQAALDRRDRR